MPEKSMIFLFGRFPEDNRIRHKRLTGLSVRGYNIMGQGSKDINTESGGAEDYEI